MLFRVGEWRPVKAGYLLVQQAGIGCLKSHASVDVRADACLIGTSSSLQGAYNTVMVGRSMAFERELWMFNASK
jgi:hypothetical protein